MQRENPAIYRYNIYDGCVKYLHAACTGNQLRELI